MHPMKTIAAAVTVGLVISLSSCSGGEPKPEKTVAAAPPAEVGTYKDVTAFEVKDTKGPKNEFTSKPFTLSGVKSTVGYTATLRDGMDTSKFRVMFALVHKESGATVDVYDGAAITEGVMLREPGKQDAANSLKGDYFVKVQTNAKKVTFTVREFK
jgi:hypothetical protein